jgi:imidazole glycerol-phosphate synthase subunit HisH
VIPVTVIDYKAGNLTSVVKALRYLDADVTVTDRPESVQASSRLILPGVGHFAATRRLDETGITSALREVIARGVPFLGICVGMQWLLSGSKEAPEQPGLGYFQGWCERFPEGAEKVPHVGWDQVVTRTSSPTELFSGVGQNEFVYYTHSYYVPTTIVPTAPAAGSLADPVAAGTEYIRTFAAAVEHENVMGVQFHPEKSSATGLRILKNFLEFRC